MFTAVTDIRMWKNGTVSTSVWWPYLPVSGQNLEELRPPKRWGFYDYLRMLVKLLPFGKIWEIPIGEEGDY